MLELKVEKREIFGKKLEKSRSGGQLPVVVYGKGKNTSHYFVNEKDFGKILREAGETSVITLNAGDSKEDVLIHDVTWHPVKDIPLHADFYIVDKNKPVQIAIPLNF